MELVNNKETCLLLFSGGKDSSAAAVKMIQGGYNIILYTYQAGMEELTGNNGDSAPDIRNNELLKVFPEEIQTDRVIEGSLYLIRKLAIEKTNSTHVVYPIALALAVHTNAIVYCLKNNIKNIACGYSGYQASEDRYIEQREDFFKLMKNFLDEYGINYHAPVINMSKEEVMDTLESFEISSNSLENKSVFGGVDFEIEHALAFWNESIGFCKEYISKRVH